MKHFYTILLALLVLSALCPHCWAQRKIEGAEHVAFHPKANIFATSSGLWSIRGKSLATDTGIGGRGVAFNPEGTILACATGSVRLWNVENPEKPKEIKFLGGKVEDAFAVAYSPDGEILAWRTLTDITLWHIKKQEIIGTKKAEHADSGIAFSRDGNALAWASPKKIVIWNVKEPKQAEEVIKAESMRAPGAPAFSPKEDVLVWRESKRVVLWNTKTKKTEHFDTEGEILPVSRALAFSPDGKRLAIFGNFGKPAPFGGRAPEEPFAPVDVLDFASGLTVARFSVVNKFAGESRSIAFSPNGETLVIGDQTEVSQHYIGQPR